MILLVKLIELLVDAAIKEVVTMLGLLMHFLILESLPVLFKLSRERVLGLCRIIATLPIVWVKKVARVSVGVAAT